jgi:HEAT repeat protein
MACRSLIFSLFFFSSVSLIAQPTEQQALRRLQDHLILEDATSAIEEGKKFTQLYPESHALQMAYMRALCEKGDELEAFLELKKLTSLSGGKEPDRFLYEMLAWGVLTKGETSSLMMIRLYSLLGSAFTQDARAIPVLIREMRSSNAFLRSIAVKISANYGDAPLQEEIARMLKEEKVWYVKLEVIQAAGRLRMTHVRHILKEIISNPKTLAEEKASSLIALISMYDEIEEKEFKALLHSDRAGLRELSCELVAHLEMKDNIGDIIPLLNDSSPSVRIACLNTIGLLGVKHHEGRPMMSYIQKRLYDPCPEVAITAAWLATVLNQKEGEAVLTSWIRQDVPEWKRLASAALAATGSHGKDLSLQLVKTEKDIFVQANLSLGLIGQRKEVDKASKILFSLLMEHGHDLWMWETSYNPLFKSLAPSRARHVEQIPRYPQVVDQHVKLDLLSVLSIIGHPKALDVVKEFLKDHTWGVTGSAASTLLEEGDDQSLEIVRKLLEDPDEKIRIQAALILAMVGSDVAAVKTLQEAYPLVDREMKMYIIEALGHIGDASSIPFLLTILEDPFQVLRVVAASALIQCIYH